MQKLLSPKQVANIIGVDHMTVFKWIREGRIESIKIGTMRRIKEDDLKAFIDVRSKQDANSKV